MRDHYNLVNSHFHMYSPLQIDFQSNSVLDKKGDKAKEKYASFCSIAKNKLLSLFFIIWKLTKTHRWFCTGAIVAVKCKIPT